MEYSKIPAKPDDLILFTEQMTAGMTAGQANWPDCQPAGLQHALNSYSAKEYGLTTAKMAKTSFTSSVRLLKDEVLIQMVSCTKDLDASKKFIERTGGKKQLFLPHRPDYPTGTCDYDLNIFCLKWPRAKTDEDRHAAAHCQVSENYRHLPMTKRREIRITPEEYGLDLRTEITKMMITSHSLAGKSALPRTKHFMFP